MFLIHYYQNAIVATLRYPDEVTDPSRFAEIRDLPETGDEELALMTKIVDKMTTDIDLSVFHDGYKERIETLIKSKMKGEVAKVEEMKPKKPVAKSMRLVFRLHSLHIIHTYLFDNCLDSTQAKVDNTFSTLGNPSYFIGFPHTPFFSSFFP